MNSIYQIIDTPLPLSQNFKELKAEGLAYIQAQSGNEWTNMNAADPGVTILDQVCYALTELGYCNDFSVKDILTGPDGQLKIKDQFYLPEDILTTSPVTKKDYRKYVIDGVDGIDNAIVVPAFDPAFPAERQYQVYLMIDANVDVSLYDKICDAVFYHLNKSRNLGESFRRPVALKKITWCISGEIQIENKNDQYNILIKLQDKISNYIFPKVIPKGYYQAGEEGIPDDELYNGPLLNNGWIPDSSLGKKREMLRSLDLAPLIESLPGVLSAKKLMFSGTTVAPGIHTHKKDHFHAPHASLSAQQEVPVVLSGRDEILYIDVVMSRVLKDLVFTCNGMKLDFEPNALLNNSVDIFDELNSPLVYGKSATAGQSLPQGDFRDINNYYSIQNTFPAIYAVGEDSTVPNASPLQVAQSRQLKGYLTLFDQVLANQFSQLANVDRLFSFKNAMEGAPSDLKVFMDTKSKFEKEHLRYPVPYMAFSPTYFYQSLYNVPDIKPLLKNNDTFSYAGSYAARDLDENSWKNYKNDPYNAYMLGLQELMVDPAADYERRNKLLDHLLARHGESPVVIDALLDGSVYSGDDLQDKVIFKSLYLQNFGLLSYFRQKAYNYLGADKLDGLSAVTYTGTEAIKLFDGNTIDFIFDSDKINELQRLSENDFKNYSALELKLNLMFGLRQVYLSYLSELAAADENAGLDFYQQLAALREGGTTNESTIQAVWLIKKRKGFIFIETALFWDYLDFNVIVTAHPHTGRQWHARGLDYKTTVKLRSMLMEADEASLDKMIKARQVVLNKTVIPLHPYQSSQKRPGDYAAIGHTGYTVMVTIDLEEEGEKNEGHELVVDAMLTNGVELFFPDFIGQFTTSEFDERIHLFMACTLPVTVKFNYHLVRSEELALIIPLYVAWYESLRYKEPYLEQAPAEGFFVSHDAVMQNRQEALHKKAFEEVQLQNKISCTKKLVKALVNIYKIR